MKTNPNTAFKLLLPLPGIGLFLLFYILAALNYPGGSWVLPEQNGFSFWHNYLCDLLDVDAINGEPNTARSYAIVSLCLLCLAIFLLWSWLPRLFISKSLNQKIMSTSGFLSLLAIPFLALGDHDKIVRIAGVFGLIAFIACALELFKASYRFLFLFELICMLTFLANYYIYETGLFISALPVIQKITFVLFITWFIVLDLALYQKSRPTLMA